jgi:threonine/homoserine/homoserine lactone efflux protein
MNYLSIFAMSFTVALIGALAPGPLLTAVIAKSPMYGFKTGPMMMVGHAAVEIAMVILLVSGLSRFMQNPLSIKIIALLGGMILISFGVDMLVRTPSLPDADNAKQIRDSNLPLLGAAVSLGNPYWSIWWLTIGLGLVLAAQKAGAVALCIFFLGHILADIIWYSIVSFTISRGKRFISGNVYKGMMKTCGVLLAGFGLYFIAAVLKKNI